MSTTADAPFVPRQLVFLLAWSLSAIGCSKGLAQVPPPSAVPPAGGPFGVPFSDSASIKVNFPNTPVQAIIPFYTQLTGKKMILDSSLQGDSLRIIAPKPLSKKEAVAFIEATLLLNGYAVIPVDKDTVKLLHHSGGKSPAAEYLQVFNSIKDLPEGDQIVHFVMPLNHISADEASKAFQQVIKLHSYGAITPVKNASAIIVTENTATIRSIFEIAQVIDVPPAEITNEMIKLERSDAESIAEIINEIYDDKEKSDKTRQTASQPQPVATAQAQQLNPNARAAAQAANANGSASTADTNPSVARVKVIPYRRTNHLLVIARPVDIAYIKGLVEKLDQQADDATFLKKKIRYMPVADFLAVAYKALAKDTDIQSDEDGGPVSGGSSPKLRRSSNTPSTDANRSQTPSSLASPYTSPYGSGYGSSSMSNATRSVLDDPDQSGSPESVVVGRTLLIADPHSNSLIVSGSPEHISTIEKLIVEMDVRPQQIYISTVIGQLNLGQEYKYGFDFLQLLDDFTLQRVREVTVSSSTSDSSGTSTDSTTTVTASSTAGTTGTDGTSTDSLTNSLQSGTGDVVNTSTQLVADTAGLLEIPLNFKDFSWNQLNLYGQIGSLAQYVNLMDQDKNFKVLSRPSIYTKNNTKAVISSGQRIAVPVSTLSNVGVGTTASVSSSIDYRDVVLKLEVIPLINSDDEVTLKIAQLNDNVVGQQTIAGSTIPTIGTQELNTEVTVKSGQTVVLGGLITEREGNNEKGVIFLRHIPIIKHLFSTTQKTKDREELLIFIQPQIIRSNDPLGQPNEIEAGRSRVFEEALNFSAPDRPVRKALPID